MIGVWELSIIEFSDSYLVRGVILCNPLPSIAIDNSWFKSARYVIKSYLRKPLSQEDILVNRVIPAQTATDGSFELRIDKNELKEGIQISYENRVLPHLQQYPLLFQYNDEKLLVISDIDETILQSFTSKAFKRITTTLFKSINKRRPIDFTRSLYAFFEERGARFFYVSKSESNLFQIITGFISKNGLPRGALFLTGYLNLKGLLKNRKEKNFKLKQIERIITQLPGKKFVLIGDDSQRDPVIYSSLAKKYEKQIAAVYIRRTRSKIAKPHSLDQQYIDNTEVPLITFRHNQQFSELFVTKEGNIFKESGK